MANGGAEKLHFLMSQTASLLKECTLILFFLIEVWLLYNVI